MDLGAYANINELSEQCDKNVFIYLKKNPNLLFSETYLYLKYKVVKENDEKKEKKEKKENKLTYNQKFNNLVTISLINHGYNHNIKKNSNINYESKNNSKQKNIKNNNVINKK